MSVPDVPTFTSQPLIVDSSTITVEFSLGSNGGSDLTDIQYARSTNNYATWASLPGLITPLGDNTSATITGLTPSAYGSYKLRSVNAIGNSGSSNAGAAYTSTSGSYYSKVVFSADNQYALATKNDGSMGEAHISSDGGVTWTTITLPTNSIRPDVAMSYDGGYMYCSLNLNNTASVCLSTDNGNTFSVLPNAPYSISNIVCNSTGQIVYCLSDANTYMYVSNDYGANFTQTAYLANIYNANIACSASGKYVYTYIYTEGVIVSTDYGVTFTSPISLSSGFIRDISCDATGQKIFVATADYLYISVNHGSSFVASSCPGYAYYGVVCDITGDRIVASTGAPNKYVSYDAGLTWKTLSFISDPYTGAGARSVSISLDGTRYGFTFSTPELYYLNIEGITTIPNIPFEPTFTSTTIVASSTSVTIGFSLGYNFGSALTAIQYARDTDNYATWTSITGLITPLEDNTSATITGLTSPSTGSYKIRAVNSAGPSAASDATTAYILNSGEYYPKVVFSSNNQYAIARKFNDGGIDEIAVSSNGGVTWTAITPPNSEACIDVAMSSDGGHMYYVSSGGVYHSTNYGVAFAQLTDAPVSVSLIVCDSTGQKVYCPSNDDNYMYVSTNAGTAFTQTTNLGFTPTSIACSADGVYVYLVNDPVVHSSNDSGLTFTSVQVYGGGPIQRIVCDQTGQKIFVAATSNIRLSLDYGTTTFIKSPYPFTSCIDIAYDSLGNRVMALQADGTISISYDAGTTWKIETILDQDTVFTTGGISISPDGTRYVSSLGAPGTYIKVEGTPDIAPIWTTDTTVTYYNGAFSPNNQNIVAVKLDRTTLDQTVVYSSDSGMSWTDVNNFGNVKRVISSLSGQTVIALMEYGGLPYISTDSGATFSEIPLVPNGDNPSSSAVMNLSGTSIMTLANDGYVYLSTDSGATWTSPYQFVDIPSSQMRIQCSSIDMGRIYVTVYPDSGLGVTFVSTDMGTSWTSLGDSPSTSDTAYIACDWSGQNLVLSANNDGIYRSTNGGVSWTHTSAPIGTATMSYIESNSTGNRIVVSDYNTFFVYVSIDAGVSWTTLCTPGNSTDGNLYGFMLSPDGSRIITGSSNVTYTQTLGAADLPLLPGAPSFTSEVTVVNGTTVSFDFAVGYPSASALTAIQYARHTDNYATWTTITGLTTPLEDATSATITGLTPPSAGSYKIRSVNINGNSAPSVASAAYILNNGEYYTKVLFSSSNQYAIAFKFNDGGSDEVAVSSDGGLTWTTITPSTGSCEDIAMSLDGTVMYYTAYDSGTYKSTDYGATFLPVAAAPLFPMSIVCNSTGQRVFVQSDDDSYIYVSEDAGATFTQGANPGFVVPSMACNASGDHIYLFNGYDIYVSTDFGVTFTLTASLDAVITSITCDQTGKLVFASAMGGYGVYVSVNYGTSFVQTSYNDYNSDDVSIVVCDSLGNRLTSLTPAGIVRVSYDAGTTWAMKTIPGQSLTFTSGGVSISPDGTRYVSALGEPGTYITIEGTPDVAPIWTVINDASYFDIFISIDNQHIVALKYDSNVGSNYVWYSSNTGVDWTQTPDFGSVYSIIASASGEVVLAFMDSGAPYLSTDYGATFSVTTLSPVGNPPSTGVINSTGTSMMVLSDGDYYVYTSIDSGATWTNQYQFTGNVSYYAMCSSISMDRMYIYMRSFDDYLYYLYLSTDMGISWTAANGIPSMYSFSMSCDWSGQKVVIAGGSDGVYRSIDGGVTFTLTTAPSDLMDIYSISSNSTGNRIVVLDYYNSSGYNYDNVYYVSLDSGATWSSLATPDTNSNNTYDPVISHDGSLTMMSSGSNTYIHTLGAADLPSVATVPDAPSFAATPTALSSTSILVQFILGSNGGSALTDLQYAREDINGFYTTWISAGLSLPLEGQSEIIINGLTPPPYGFYKLRTVNDIGPSAESAAGYVVPPATVPDAPSFTRPPTLISDSSIHFEFSLGSDGGSALTDLQYARDTDSYQTWTSLGLSLPLAGQTTADITGLTSPATGSYKLRAVNVAGESDSVAELAYILNAGEYYKKVRFSSDNQYAISLNTQSVPRPVVSLNGGLTWTIIDPSSNNHGHDVAMSLDGNYMYYSADDGIYKSTNHGDTFSHLINNLGYASTIACDSTGQYVYSSSQFNDKLYFSDDFGENFVWKDIFGNSLRNLTCSASGRYLYLHTSSNDDQLYVSNDYGATFTQINIGSGGPSGIACDQTGEKVYVAANGNGGVLYSTNYGQSFSGTSLSGIFVTVACSSLGNHVIAMSYDGVAYVSRNAGASWEQMNILGQNSATISWRLLGASISPDGTRYVSARAEPGTYIKIEDTADLPTVPDAPSFTSPPTYLSDTSISIDFTLGANGGSDIIRIEYAREGNYNIWTPISGLTSPVTITVGYPSIGNYKLRAVNAIGPSDASAAGLVEVPPPVTVPDAPSFASQPTYVSDTSISIDFTLGANGGSDIIRIEYAREEQNYNSWTPISGLTSPVTITVDSPSDGYYKLRAVNAIGPSDASLDGLVVAPPPVNVPYAPIFTTAPAAINSTSIYIQFFTGNNNGSTLTDLQYARADINGFYTTWISAGLSLPIESQSDGVISGLTPPIDGFYKIRTVNAFGPSAASTRGYVEALPATVPDAPSFTSPPTIVDTTTIHVEYTLGSNGGSPLTDLQYAREEEGSYNNWISIPDLPSTIDGTSSINITGLTSPVTGNYKLRAVNNEGPSDASTAGLVEATVPCFLEGSKILCKVDGVEKYVAVETIRPGTLVKTSLHGYQPVKLIGSRVMVNAGGDKRDKNSLYLCTKANYPELTEDLIITGCHAILVDHITDVHRQGIIQTLERVFVTDKKYRLPACVDERAPVYQPTGTFTVWHFALEHTDIKMNYGVYAHGLLVESSPIWHMNTKNYKLVQ